MKIYAPVHDCNGLYASVMFKNGVGETDNPTLIDWFKTHGYKVEDTYFAENEQNEQTNDQINQTNEQNEQNEPEVGMMEYAEKTPNFEGMNPNELREWMKQNGYGPQIKNTRNKEKLLEILRG